MNITDQEDVEMQVDALLMRWNQEFMSDYYKPKLQTLDAIGQHLAQVRAQNKAGQNDTLRTRTNAGGV